MVNSRRLCRLGMGVSAQGLDELGHLLVALDAAEGSFGSTICPSRQRVTSGLVVRAIEIIDSTGLLLVSGLASRPSMPRETVNISSSPSRSDAAALG